MRCQRSEAVGQCTPICPAAECNCAPSAKNRLFTDVKRADHFTVAIEARALEVVEKAAALRNKAKQTTPRMVIFDVSFKVISQIANTLSNESNLHFRRTGVRRMGTELVNQFSLFFSMKRHAKRFSSQNS